MLFDAATFCDKENNVSFDTDTKIIHHKGFKLNKKWEGKIATTCWCTNCKSSKSKCSLKIKVDFFGKVVNKMGTHDVECRIKSKNSRQALRELTNSNDNNPNSSGIDYTSYMKKRVNEMALENIYLSPKEICTKILKEMDGMQRTWKGSTDYQVTTRV